MNPKIRKKESPWVHAFWTNYILLLHAITAVAISFFMLNVIDDKVVNFNRGVRFYPRADLQADDITTVVSVATVVIRIITGAWAARSAWRCAFILLETQGITLQQFNRMVSWPAYFLRGSTDAYIATLVLLLLVPANLVSPVITGSVGWKGVAQVVATRNFQSTGPALAGWPWYWYLNSTRSGYTAEILVQHAASRAGVGWLGFGMGSSRSSRLVVSGQQMMPVNSTIEDLTLPFLRIHSISWDKKADFSKDITDELDSSLTIKSRLTLSGKRPFNFHHGGNAVLFDEHFLDNLPRVETYIGSDQATSPPVGPPTPPPPPTVFHDTKKIAVLLTREGKSSCSTLGETIFGSEASMANLKDLYSYFNSFHDNCFLIGTINFTAGVIKKQATFITESVIEAHADYLDPIEEDNWVIESLYLLPDVMTKVSMLNVSRIPTWENLDGYVEALTRISYQATWGEVTSQFNALPINLTVQELGERLKTVVSKPRVIGWYCAQFLVLVSATLLWVLQRRSNRPIAIDAGVVALLVDAAPILNRYDESQELSRMSYAMGSDGGMVQLAERDISGIGEQARFPENDGSRARAPNPPKRFTLVPKADGV